MSRAEVRAAGRQTGPHGPSGWDVIRAVTDPDLGVGKYERLTLLALCRHMDSDGVCWPSDARVAAEIGCSIKTVRRARSELRRAGLLSWITSPTGGTFGAGTNRYTLDLGALLNRGQADHRGRADHGQADHRGQGVPNRGQGDRGTVVRQTDKHAHGTSSEQAHLSSSYPDAFLEWWQAYPRKVAKGAALRAWKRLGRKRPPLAELVAAVGRQAASEQWHRDGGRYIPHPATWLSQGRWEDDLGGPPGTADSFGWGEDARSAPVLIGGTDDETRPQ